MTLATPAYGHDWYDSQHNPITGGRCCGGYDCGEIPSTSVQPHDDGSYTYLPQNFLIPKEHVQRSPDNRFHICEDMALPSPMERERHALWRHYWTCFFAPELVN